MWHKLLRDARFHQVLLEVDREIATETRANGCPACRGRLHAAPYERKRLLAIIPPLFRRSTVPHQRRARNGTTISHTPRHLSCN